MAFNPFEAFSIRSKLGRSVMAILGIVVMLTFVLSTGAVGSRNDFFDQLGSMFSSRGRGEVLAVAYGDDVHESDLIETRRQREAAREYLNQVNRAAYTGWADELKRDLENNQRVSADFRNGVTKFLAVRADVDKNPATYRKFLMEYQQLQQFRQQFGSMDLQQFGNMFRDAGAFDKALTQARAKADSEDKRMAEAVTAILANDMVALPPYLDPQLGEPGPESDRDNLDFILLLKKADQLGIRFSDDGVQDLMAADMGGRRLSPDTLEGIQRRLREAGGRRGGFSPDWLNTAVANEYRARAALAAVEGEPPIRAAIRRIRAEMFPGSPAGGIRTASAEPGAVTPQEFWDFYQDRCSEHTFSVLEVKADPGQVTDAPVWKDGDRPPKELADLFNKYRRELPDPASDHPGFKEPRKVKVEFATLDATAKRVTDAIPKYQAAHTFLSATAGAIDGNPAAALTQAASPALFEGLQVLEKVGDKMDANLSRYQDLEQFLFTPRDVSVYRPAPLVALLAGFAGHPSPAGGAAPTAAVPLALMTRQIEAHDLKTRVPFLLQPWFTPFTPTLGNAVGMPAFAYALNPKLPPEGVYVPEARREVQKRQRHELFEADVKKLQDKLRELVRGGKDPDPMKPEPKPDKAKLEKGREEAARYLADWLKDRGLTSAGTPEPVDEYSVANNPVLKVLADPAGTDPEGTNALSKRLFPDPRSFPGPDGQPFHPFWFPSQPVGNDLDKPNHLVWVSQEVEPTEYRNLENANSITKGEMGKRVLYEWKLAKARDLARARAEQLAQQVRNIGKAAPTDRPGVEMQLNDLAKKEGLKLFDLDRLAVLKFEHGLSPSDVKYVGPKVEKTQVLYPTPDFADQLLKLREGPQAGGVTVVSDAPRTRYYVACEVARFPRTVEQFREVFVKSTAAGPAKNPLYDNYALPKERQEANARVFARLRADARLDEKEAFKNRDKRRGDQGE